MEKLLARTDLMTRAQYVSILKPHLPPNAFKPARTKLLWILGYSLLFIFTCWIFRQTDSWYVYLLLCALQCHTLSSLAFLAHDLSHGSIVRTSFWRYPLELWQWGVVLVPPTLWKRVHNQAHHTHASTPSDPDRNYLPREACRSTLSYERLFYPSSKSIKWSPLVGFHFVPYVIRNILAVLPLKSKLRIVPAVPDYRISQRIRIGLELIWITLFQVSIFLAVGSWQAYLFASPLAILGTSTIVMVYIFTNHWLNPVSETADPVVGSTSVIVPTIFDRLHFHFSYHTEHHLFPSINSAYLPEVSQLIRKYFPERYNVLSIGVAWDRLWKLESFVSENENNSQSATMTGPESEP